MARIPDEIIERLKQEARLAQLGIIRESGHEHFNGSVVIPVFDASGAVATARAWELKEAFRHFWKYRSLLWAGAFLDYWCQRAMRSRLEPMKRIARMLRTHETLILNWFRAKGEISSGSVEGLNNKIRVVTRRSYGFRSYEAMEIALYHTLGRLPEPESTHKFC